MQLKTTDTPPKPSSRYDYAVIAERVEGLQTGQGLQVLPCPTNITLFRQKLFECVSNSDQIAVFVRRGACWISKIKG